MNRDGAKESATRVLAVLTAVYVVNFLDRQVLSILLLDVREDFDLTGADMGFLVGTAFAVFYGAFGVPLGRMADVGNRPRLLGWALLAWSVATFVSGVAQSASVLVLARIGLGVAQSAASPTSYALIAETSAPERRATALGIYSCAIFVGIGCASMLGGTIADALDNAWRNDRGFGIQTGLRGWQVAFVVAALPGFLLAPFVFRLPDPRPRPSDRSAVAELWTSLSMIVPPLTLGWLRRDRRAVSKHLAWLAATAGATALLVRWTGDVMQWATFGAGVAAVGSWIHVQLRTDPRAARFLFRNRSLGWVTAACALISFTGYAWTTLGATWFRVQFDLSRQEVGTTLGPVKLLSGFLGILVGGWMADRLRRRRPTGRLLVILATALLPLPFYYACTRAPEPATAFTLLFIANVFSTLWFGAGASTVQSVVPADLRGRASGWYLLVITFVGLGLGPYTVGALYDRLGDLSSALVWSLAASVAGAYCAWTCGRSLSEDEAAAAPPPEKRIQNSDVKM